MHHIIGTLVMYLLFCVEPTVQNRCPISECERLWLLDMEKKLLEKGERVLGDGEGEEDVTADMFDVQMSLYCKTICTQVVCAFFLLLE